VDADILNSSNFEDARAEAMKKGYLTQEDYYRMYCALLCDVEQLERDLAHVAENRPDVRVNPDCSLERARVEQIKPAGYDEWAERNPT